MKDIVIVEILFAWSKSERTSYRNVSFGKPSFKVSQKNANAKLPGKYSVKWTDNFITVAIIYVLLTIFYPPIDMWAEEQFVMRFITSFSIYFSPFSLFLERILKTGQNRIVFNWSSDSSVKVESKNIFQNYPSSLFRCVTRKLFRRNKFS